MTEQAPAVGPAPGRLPRPAPDARDELLSAAAPADEGATATTPTPAPAHTTAAPPHLGQE
ncbi:hypothetical protein [Streptomyces sp. NPDC059894]|uniref:hypothetical protein n=1 Tax=unclassified Streptomyces TaxID=2593676 RepID=UPI003649D183